MTPLAVEFTGLLNLYPYTGNNPTLPAAGNRQRKTLKKIKNKQLKNKLNFFDKLVV